MTATRINLPVSTETDMITPSEITPHKITVEEFARIPHSKHTELVDGVIVERTLLPGYENYEEEKTAGNGGGLNAALAGIVFFFLRLYLLKNPIGHITGADGTYILKPPMIRTPDVAFISKTRLPVLPVGYIPMPPDLAVEIISPTNSATDMERKRKEYLENSVKLVWMIYPDTLTAHAHLPDNTGSIVDIDGALEGGEVLPGFTLPLRDLFADLIPSPTDQAGPDTPSA